MKYGETTYCDKCGVETNDKRLCDRCNQHQTLSLKDWENIFRNLREMDEEDYYDGVVDWVEVIWLDGTDEWILSYGEEVFEDGFKTEREAQERLSYLEKTLL